jgi:uncharacterized phage-associated protein
MTASNANFVADALIHISHQHSDPVTNLKLQKLLYYAQAWHLVLFDDALFDEAIEAWVHGPVVPSIFRRFRDNRWSVLEDSGSILPAARTREHLDDVWKVFGKYNAYDLERMTHSEAPWKAAREGLAPDVSSHNIISLESMKSYYQILNA